MIYKFTTKNRSGMIFTLDVGNTSLMKIHSSHSGVYTISDMKMVSVMLMLATLNVKNIGEIICKNLMELRTVYDIYLYEDDRIVRCIRDVILKLLSGQISSGDTKLFMSSVPSYENFIGLCRLYDDKLALGAGMYVMLIAAGTRYIEDDVMARLLDGECYGTKMDVFDAVRSVLVHRAKTIPDKDHIYNLKHVITIHPSSFAKKLMADKINIVYACDGKYIKSNRILTTTPFTDENVIIEHCDSSNIMFYNMDGIFSSPSNIVTDDTAISLTDYFLSL